MDPHTEPAHNLHDLVHEIAARATVAVGLGAIGVIHLLDSIGKYGETRYVFWLYIALIAGCIVVGGAVLFTRRRSALLAAAALAAGAAAGYVLSRTTGLPNATGDVGNWTEPLGLASLFVEGGVFATAVGAFVKARRTATAPARIRTTARVGAAQTA